MKYQLLVFVFVCSGIISTINIQAQNNYYHELKAYKKDIKTRAIFDDNAHSGLSSIQQDIDIFKELSFFQRFVRHICFLFDVIIVTPKNLPILYDYIDTLCKNANIETPTIFVTRKKGLFNAFAQKYLMSSGAIVIGQQIMKECTDEVLEAIVAHEIGHIKHNHVNKMICINLISVYIASKIIHYYYKHPNTGLTIFLGQLIASLIINKRFEKEADQFACIDAHKPHGIIGFFEHLEHKDIEREDQFNTTYDLINDNKAYIDFSDYLRLKTRYYVAKVGHYFTKAYKWVYYNTFYGAHPSPQERIQAAQEYIENLHK